MNVAKFTTKIANMHGDFFVKLFFFVKWNFTAAVFKIRLNYFTGYIHSQIFTKSAIHHFQIS